MAIQNSLSVRMLIDTLVSGLWIRVDSESDR